MDVNKAWDRLHTRLVDEQLLIQTAEIVVIPFVTIIRWAAAIVVLCVFGGIISLYMSSEKENQPLISIHNSDKTNTLVKTLDDGSVVYLTCGATINCPERFAADKRKVNLHGEALFDIRNNQNCPFFIETELVVVEVLGTAFNIKTAGKESFELSVQHGLVKVMLKTSGIHVFAETGETVRLKDHQQLLIELSDNQQQFAKYSEKICFKDEKLENIVHVINKISDKPVSISDDVLKNRGITIPFSNNTVEEMVELLCEVLDLKYFDDGKEIVIGW